jgi:hypothetical protein
LRSLSEVADSEQTARTVGIRSFEQTLGRRDLVDDLNIIVWILARERE